MSETKFPTEIIDLPSEGYFYPSENPLSSGKIEIKYMTAKEEDILTSKNLIQKGIVIDTLLKSLIITPIDYNDLLIGDKNAIIIASRILAYGKNYDVKIQCSECNESSNLSIDLSTFENKEIDMTVFKKNSKFFNYILPFSKKNIELKLPTHLDEQNIDNEIKSMKKISAQTGVDKEITTRLRNIVVSVDGNSDREVVNKFINTELLSKDSFELRKFLRKHTPDIDMMYNFECNSCSKSNNIPIPLTAEFFWPTGRE